MNINHQITEVKEHLDVQLCIMNERVSKSDIQIAKIQCSQTFVIEKVDKVEERVAMLEDEVMKQKRGVDHLNI